MKLLRLNIILIFLIFLTISSNYANDTSNINDVSKDNNIEVPKYILDYTHDGDLYSFIAVEYKDRVKITKNITKSFTGKVRYHPEKMSLHSDFIYELTENTEENLKKYPIIESKTISGNIECIEYDIGKKGTLKAVVADDYYIVLHGSPVLDVKKISDNTYMVLYQQVPVIEYVHVGLPKIVVEVHFLPTSLFGSQNIPKPKPKIGSILTDNIIRLEYDSGLIEYWKVRLTKEDIEKNIVLDIKADIHNYFLRKLVWWNNNMGIGGTIDHETHKSWDYIDSSVEPIYEYKFK